MSTAGGDSKIESHIDFHEFDTRTVVQKDNSGVARMVESVRMGLTVLALLAAITIVGTSADTLGVYNRTSLNGHFAIAIWPSDFDIRPTVALVTCGAIITLASAISLVVAKLPAIRNKTLINNALNFLAPTICLIAGLIATSFFYGINGSSSVSSLHSWTCQWSSVAMGVQPHWGTLCKESKVGLYLSVMMIPLEALVLATAAFAVVAERRTIAAHERKGSPALS